MERTTNKQDIMIANRGDKVVCVGRGGCKFITIGKIYEVLDFDTVNDSYLMICDDGDSSLWYYVGKFIPLNEWREQQINKIL